MTTKIVYSIYIDSKVREKARDYGVNVSKVSENALRLLLQRLEGYSPISETVSTSTNSLQSAKEAIRQ
jgi:hypothetical protein